MVFQSLGQRGSQSQSSIGGAQQDQLTISFLARRNRLLIALFWPRSFLLTHHAMWLCGSRTCVISSTLLPVDPPSVTRIVRPGIVLLDQADQPSFDGRATIEVGNDDGYGRCACSSDCGRKVTLY